MSDRAILHVDMDAFFASVEQRDHPEHAGLPLLVGGTGGRGVVAAASYEARRFGIHSAMPMREALRRCPDAICVRPRIERYKQVSRQVFEVFHEITPQVEPLSVDEAFLDVTASQRLHGDPVHIAQTIKVRIQERTALTASVGVAANKLVAKIASDLDKPDGLTVINAADARSRLASLPASVLPGIGKRKQAELSAAGLTTLGDLQSAAEPLLHRLFGKYALRMRERASGRDTREVIPDRDEKSVSSERTFDTDLSSSESLKRALSGLADKTAARLRNKSLAAGVIQLKIRQSDFQTFTRQTRVRPATNGSRQIYDAALELLREWRAAHPGQAVRLLGVGGQALETEQQLDMFDGDSSTSSVEVDGAIDEVRERFSELGIAALRPARTLEHDDSD
ncbi:MAG: DNA polymerase IV [Pseudomonadota bacterium]